MLVQQRLDLLASFLPRRSNGYNWTFFPGIALLKFSEARTAPSGTGSTPGGPEVFNKTIFAAQYGRQASGLCR